MTPPPEPDSPPVVPSQGGPAASPFTHGVASFDPLADRVLLWTRVDPASVPRGGTEARLGWHVALEPGGEPLREGTVAVPADTEGCVVADVDGLAPATTYHYWFDLGGTVSPIGRTRTLPEGPTEWFRMALVCCADRSMGPLDAYRAIAEDEVDVVVHVGDYLYESAKGPYPVEPRATCVTLADYRRRHAHTRLDRDLQAMHLRHPVVFVWDDHDVADNAWRHGAKEHDPDEHGPWEERLGAATRARDEWLPARLRDPGDRLAMWRSFAVGDLAELVVLDTRIPGRDLQSGDEGAKALDDPTRRLLEPAQRRWAHERVRDRTRPWCLLISQVPVADLELPVPAGSLVDDVLPSGYRVIDGEAICTDLWEGYPVERRELARAIAGRGEGVVILSGDVHSNWVTTFTDDDGRGLAGELVVTSVSSTPLGDQLPPGWRTEAEKVAGHVPGLTWQDIEHHGYLHLDVRPEAVRGDYLAIEPSSGTALPERLASWAMDRSMPPRWREAVPDSPLGTFADVVRPGLPLDQLPPPEPPAGLRARHLARQLSMGLSVGAAAAVSVALVVRAALRHRR
jgi:alkaline phosphatase D